jgi:hypothetical protein
MELCLQQGRQAIRPASSNKQRTAGAPKRAAVEVRSQHCLTRQGVPTPSSNRPRHFRPFVAKGSATNQFHAHANHDRVSSSLYNLEQPLHQKQAKRIRTEHDERASQPVSASNDHHCDYFGWFNDCEGNPQQK